MEPEDLEPRTKRIEKRNLDVLAVREIEGYIAELEEEIARARAAIKGKSSHKNAAEAFFKR
ncbi:MAG: DUF1192 family protein [Alphaproteobacteria bacterium]